MSKFLDEATLVKGHNIASQGRGKLGELYRLIVQGKPKYMVPNYACCSFWWACVETFLVGETRPFFVTGACYNLPQLGDHKNV